MGLLSDSGWGILQQGLDLVSVKANFPENKIKMVKIMLHLYIYIIRRKEVLIQEHVYSMLTRKPYWRILHEYTIWRISPEPPVHHNWGLNTAPPQRRRRRSCGCRAQQAGGLGEAGRPAAQERNQDEA